MIATAVNLAEIGFPSNQNKPATGGNGGLARRELLMKKMLTTIAEERLRFNRNGAGEQFVPLRSYVEKLKPSNDGLAYEIAGKELDAVLRGIRVLPQDMVAFVKSLSEQGVIALQGLVSTKALVSLQKAGAMNVPEGVQRSIMGSIRDVINAVRQTEEPPVEAAVFEEKSKAPEPNQSAQPEIKKALTLDELKSEVKRFMEERGDLLARFRSVYIGPRQNKELNSALNALEGAVRTFMHAGNGGKQPAAEDVAMGLGRLAKQLQNIKEQDLPQMKAEGRDKIVKELSSLMGGLEVAALIKASR